MLQHKFPPGMTIHTQDTPLSSPVQSGIWSAQSQGINTIPWLYHTAEWYNHSGVTNQSGYTIRVTNQSGYIIWVTNQILIIGLTSWQNTENSPQWHFIPSLFEPEPRI